MQIEGKKIAASCDQARRYNKLYDQLK